MRFASRRSVVHGTRGCVASSQPLASAAGLEVLQAGGNAVDAAVATAAALNVTEPCSTGIGGDCFMLYYDSSRKTVEAMLGNGKSPAALTGELLGSRGISESEPWAPTSALCVTVPGAAAGWCDAVQRWGSLPVSTALRPAIRLASEGFVVSEIAAHHWKKSEELLRDQNGRDGGGLLFGGAAPVAGQRVCNPDLAATLRCVAENGKSGFYEGRIAEALCSALRDKGGVMSPADLRTHTTEFQSSISVDYRGYTIHEVPPPTQGLTALMALKMVERHNLKAMGHNSPQYLHTLVEAVRLAFADTQWFVTDPKVEHVPVQEMLRDEYIAQRAALIDDQRASSFVHGVPNAHSETVYFAAVDKDGNACSMINSNYMGFGTGIVPGGCGFTLQNRGYGFSLNPAHPNRVAPGKRPYHTIIPGLATRNGELAFTFGVMGGFMQPQGHLQVLCNMLDFGQNPQEALDSLRFCVSESRHTAHTSKGSTAMPVVCLEEGMPEQTAQQLKQMGHDVEVLRGHARSMFGRGQIITRRDEGGGQVLSAGSDPRADGCAMAW